MHSCDQHFNLSTTVYKKSTKKKYCKRLPKSLCLNSGYDIGRKGEPPEKNWISNSHQNNFQMYLTFRHKKIKHQY